MCHTRVVFFIEDRAQASDSNYGPLESQKPRWVQIYQVMGILWYIGEMTFCTVTSHLKAYRALQIFSKMVYRTMEYVYLDGAGSAYMFNHFFIDFNSNALVYRQIISGFWFEIAHLADVRSHWPAAWDTATIIIRAVCLIMFSDESLCNE